MTIRRRFRIAVEPRPAALQPGNAIAVKVDGGFSHDFNYQNRSRPGALYRASPLTIAASAFMGRIVAYDPKMFSEVLG